MFCRRHAVSRQTESDTQTSGKSASAQDRQKAAGGGAAGMTEAADSVSAEQEEVSRDNKPMCHSLSLSLCQRGERESMNVLVTIENLLGLFVFLFVFFFAMKV